MSELLNAQPQAGSAPNTANNPQAAAPAPAKPAQQAEPAKAEPQKSQQDPPAAQAGAASQASPFLTVRYNHRAKDLTEAEAREYAQKGMGYDKAVERERNAGADAWVAMQNFEWDGKKLTTQEEYKRAMFEKKLVDGGMTLPEARKAYDNHPDVVAARKIKEDAAKLETEQARESDMDDFLAWFEKENGRPLDPKKDEIPQEVWQENARGTPLTMAYRAIALPKILQGRIKTMETEAEKNKVNAQNAASSTGSAAGNGAQQEQTHFTREQVMAMSAAEEAKNHEKIRESMKTWK